jgi:hypothetical protein
MICILEVWTRLCSCLTSGGSVYWYEASGLRNPDSTGKDQFSDPALHLRLALQLTG